MSLKAGGQGLNLTRATYVFHLDPWWNPAVENQASDRAHRIGQMKKVIITRLIMRHTIEEKMMELKRRKLKLYQAILELPSAGGRLPITKRISIILLGDVLIVCPRGALPSSPTLRPHIISSCGALRKVITLT